MGFLRTYAAGGVLGLFLVLTACGGATAAARADGGSGTGSDAATDAEAGIGSPCPAAPPGQGDACGPQGLECEWGTSLLEECDLVGTCNGGRWELIPVGPGTCGPSPAGTCPVSFGGVPRQSHCAPDGLECTYPQGLCACVPPAGPPGVDASADAEWACQDPGPGCPEPRPLLGSPCSSQGLQCDYGACSIPGGTAESCEGGLWVTTPVHCPAAP